MGRAFARNPLSKMCALEIGRAKRKSNDGKIKRTDRQYVTNETSRYKSHFVYNKYLKCQDLDPKERRSQETHSKLFDQSLPYLADSAKNVYIEWNNILPLIWIITMKMKYQCLGIAIVILFIQLHASQGWGWPWKTETSFHVKKPGTQIRSDSFTGTFKLRWVTFSDKSH